MPKVLGPVGMGFWTGLEEGSAEGPAVGSGLPVPVGAGVSTGSMNSPRGGVGIPATAYSSSSRREVITPKWGMDTLAVYS